MTTSASAARSSRAPEDSESIGVPGDIQDPRAVGLLGLEIERGDSPHSVATPRGLPPTFRPIANDKLPRSASRVKQRYTSKVMRGFAGTMSEDLKKEFEVSSRTPRL